MDYDATTLAQVYDCGRGYPPGTMEKWLQKVARSAAQVGVREILDVGCGTGRYTGPLADRFRARVCGIDPSASMLERARATATDRVNFCRAAAESLPFPPAHFDLLFISMAFHHFEDRCAALQECRRVIRDPGILCLRAGTRERVDSYPYTRFFPGAREILCSDLVPAEEIKSQFGRAGFELVSHELVDNVVATSWREYCAKMAWRADSVIERLDDAAFEAGLRALDRHAVDHPDPTPISELVDFFVFRPG